MDINQFRETLKTVPINELAYKIIGIAAFGSRVTNEYRKESDLDLLVVASDIPEKRHRRGKAIAALKQKLPPIPLDIILMTEEETISNFKNHNPLFLDISVEGVVLLDTGNFLAELIDEVREYIKNNNIQKIKDGWIFPVKAGAPTFLSLMLVMKISQGLCFTMVREILRLV